MSRAADVSRDTRETRLRVTLDLDASAGGQAATGNG